ncbi:MAG: ABC transporter ATP-binding protein, partial [Syntrophales bacterium]|nr:ABC transporter ATP-binding protein [Syntrophales bacterium]
MPHSLLTAKNLKVERGGRTVLEIADFSLQEGDVLALIGPNGAGKTTFLLALACLLKPSEGRLAFKGEQIDLHELAFAYRRKLSMVFQEPLLLDTAVFNNVAAGLRIRKMSRGEIGKRVAAYAELFNISHLLDRSARKLSGGEAQRTSLARAFATEPEIIFLDEPLANLDAPSRSSLIDDLHCILRQTGTTAILATHDRLEALRLADRLAVMNGGRIIQMGTCNEVMNHPVNEVAASFVGMETVFSGYVQKVYDGSFIASVSGHDIEASGDVEVGEKVVCCIGPEHIIISTHKVGEGTSIRNNLPGRIVKIVPHGHFYKIHLDCGFFIASYVTHQSLETLSLREEKPVTVSFKATAVHVIRR